MKICVIGAGITGLTVANLLKDFFDVIVYEKDKLNGGIAKTKIVGGHAYHMVGGHCFNSKNQLILDYVFKEVLRKDKWHLVERNAKINFKDHLISYPIEYSIKEIYQFDKNLAFNITKDFIEAKILETDNLEDWFKVRFGNTLAYEYFIPYNKKIWNMEPSQMSPEWVDGKLPIPNKQDFFESLITTKKDKMPHSQFYYPNTNNQQSLIDALAKNLEIVNDYSVSSIKKNGNGWIVNDDKYFDIIINTAPLDFITKCINDIPIEILYESEKLKFNKVTTMFWKTNTINNTWTYFPDPKTIFHRHIHIGNFYTNKESFTITEAIGEHSYEEMLAHGRQFEYLIEPLDYNVSEHAYVVYDENRNYAVNTIRNYLKDIGIYSIGRFGEWEYYNMDLCMESAMKLAKNLKEKFGKK